MSSTTPDTTADAVQVIVDHQTPTNGRCQVLIKSVQIDLRRPCCMYTEVYIRSGKGENKSKWFGFCKYSQINWELGQPYDVSDCDDIEILWGIRCPLRKNNPCKTIIVTREDIESVASQQTGTVQESGMAITRKYKCKGEKCSVTVSFIVREDPRRTPSTSTVQDTAANAPVVTQAVAPADTPSIIEQVTRPISSVSHTQIVEPAKESQGNTPPEPLPISVDVPEGVEQTVTAPYHTSSDTEGAHVQTSSSQPVPRAGPGNVPIEDVQEGRPDTEHKPKDQQPIPLPDIVHEVAKDAEQIKSVCDRLGNSVYYLKGVMRLGEFISELHPALEVSIKILTSVIEILNVEDTRNKEIIQLIVGMSDIVNYVVDVEQFATVEQLKAVIEEANELMQKTVEFFNKHKGRGTLKRFLAAFSPSAKEELEGLQVSFSRIKEKFDRGMSVQIASILQTQLRALYDGVLKTIDTNHATRFLRCLEGTRQDLIRRILEWTLNFAKSVFNILWIYGYPGAGKSTLAMHIAMLLRTTHRRLAVVIEFSRTTGVTPMVLWKTVAYALAREYPICRRVIVSELRGVTLDLSNATPSEIFNRLVAEPLRHLTASGTKIEPDRLPVVIIDALDECGGLDGSSRQARKEILDCVTKWAELAPGVKLIITSRAEQDIKQTLSTIPHTPFEIHTGDSVTEVSTLDIHLYMKGEFKRIASDNEMVEDWPGDEIVTDLARRAQGVFIWATTVIEFIGDDTPKRQLEVIQYKTLPSGNVYGLYRQILESSFSQKYDLERFRDVVSAIVVAQQQFMPAELGELLGLDVDEINNIRKRLRTVLDDVVVVRFKHQSFVDFLLSTPSSSDPMTCSERFHINVADAHRRMFEALFRFMNKKLRFNICQIPSSFLRNDRLPSGHFENVISRPLAYACRFWGSHLENLQSTVNIDLVNTFIHEHFLSWLEVLSVHQSVSNAARFLNIIVDRLTSSSEQSDSLKDLIDDATTFIGFCEQAIAVSASHIYTSALAFAPKSSKIAQLYTPRFRNLIDLDVGRLDKWPAKQSIIHIHFDSVTFVAFSPDGRQIILCPSGRYSSDDSDEWSKTVCAYDVATGQITAGPFRHTERVLCAVYSTDGKNILSASTDGTIRTWYTEPGVVDGPVEYVTVLNNHQVDCAAFSHNRKYIASAHRDRLNGNQMSYISLHDVETGAIVLGSFVALGRRFTCHAFSPDDRGVASGSDDGTVCVWSTQTGELEAGPFRGHEGPVECISYSHNGAFVLSGSYDCTIRLWEVGRTPAQIRVYRGHTAPVKSVAFSSGDRWVVSGSEDYSVRVWDVKTGDVVVRRLVGLSYYVASAPISPDGKRIASSSDGTVHIWDVGTYWGRRKFLYGHDDTYYLALSNDRRHVVSGSDYGTIQYWDMGTGELVGSLCEGNGVAVESVAYSPDGKYVVSGYFDGTVRIWEVASGRIEMELRGYEDCVYSVAFSNNGRFIASTSYKTNRIWDAETGRCIHTLQEDGLFRISFSPDDKHVLSNWKNGFRIWDVETGSLVIQSKQGHKNDVKSTTFSHDGKLVATASEDKTIRLWNATTGEHVLDPFIGHTGSVYSVAFSPDDKFIVSGSDDRTVRVWNVSTGQTILGPLRGHMDCINLVSFSLDGSSVFSLSSPDRTIRIWSTEQVQPTPFTDESVLGEDGWVKGKNDELLFWVPECHRLSLHRPDNTRVLGPNETQIDFTNARLGDKWAECYTP